MAKGKRPGKKAGKKASGGPAGKKDSKKATPRTPAVPAGRQAAKAGLLVPAGKRASPPARAEVARAAASLFAPEETERLRLVVLTSARREEKVEALRRLAYSPLDPNDKADMFLGRLADQDAEVRVEAAQLLRSLGLDQDVAEAVREIEHGEEPEKLFAIDRLGRRMATGGPLEVAAGLIALIWRLREERSSVVRTQILERLIEASPVIASVPERAEELVRLLVGLYAASPVDVGSPARRLVRALGRTLADGLRGILWSEYDGTGSRKAREFIVQLLAGLAGADADERLPGALADEVSRADESDLAFRILGDALMNLGDRGVGALLDAFPAARPAQQRYIIRLLADGCRFRSISGAVKEQVASLFLALLTGHQRDLQMTVLSTQMPADADLAEKTRAELAEHFLTHVDLFAFPADRDNVEHTVARAGFAAVDVLVARLGPGNSPKVRVRAVRILGELARLEGEGLCGKKRKSFLDILRTLQRWSLDPDFPDQAAVFTAMGKVASAPAVPADTVELVARNLLERGGLLPEAPASERRQAGGHRVFQALGYLAGSPHISAARVSEIETIFTAQLASDLPDIAATEEPEEEGVAVFSIGPEAEVYTEAVPAAVAGLGRIGLGRNAGPARVERIVEFLIERWKLVAAGNLEWGPPGTTALVETMRDLACGRKVDVRHKIRIVRELARRLSQIPVVEALGVVFDSEDVSRDLGRIAAAVGAALLRRRESDGQFREDERESALGALGKIAARATLDVASDVTARLREEIAEQLLAGVRDGVQGAYEALSRLRGREGLPEEFRESVARRLAAYESLVPT